MLRFNDLSEQKFGDWTAIKKGEKRSHNQTYWLCVCVCGTRKEVSYSSLVSGSSKGCGCKRGDRFSRATRNKDRTETILRHDYASISKRHKAKGFDVRNRISFDQYKEIVIKPCFYCGIESSRSVGDYSSYGKRVTNKVLAINGIDRMDSSIGYTIDNVVPCCVYCNRAKSDMSIDDFKEWAIRLCDHFAK